MKRAIAIVTLVLLASPLVAEDWPQWRGPNRDGVWTETGLVERFESDQLEIKWRTPIESGYSGPTVAGGRVYVTDRVEEPEDAERIHCLDEQTGEILWTHAYDCSYRRGSRSVGYPAGPRASVTIDDGRAYALGTMGHLHCLDAATGEVLWQKTPGVDYNVKTPIWGISSAPLIVDDLVIVQIGVEDGPCIVGLDRKTGEERWGALADQPSYSSPIMIQQAGRPVLVYWTGDNCVGMNAATGDVYWTYPTPPNKMAINVPTPLVEGNLIFLSSFYDGSYMLKLGQDAPTVSELWRREGANERKTDALHCMIGTGYFEGDYVYGVDSYGELRCLEAATGDRVWEDLTAVPIDRWATIHMVRNGDNMWMFNERGELLIGRLSPEGFTEISRAKLLEPTMEQLPKRDGVCWSHPAYANRCVFARNDKEIVCASLAAE